MVFALSEHLDHSPARSLETHRFFIRFAHSLINAFVWVFFFEQFLHTYPLDLALLQTFGLYALSQTTALLAIPFAMRRLQGGMREGVVLGSLLFAIWLIYAALFLAGEFPHGAILIALLMGFARAFYRVPYAVEHNASARPAAPSFGREFLLLASPVIAGALLTMLVPPFAFLALVSFLPILSLIAFSTVPPIYERFAWGYTETFANLILAEHRALLLSSMRQGAIAAFLFLIWPFVLYFAAPSYFAAGASFSATLTIIFLFRSGRGEGPFRSADGGHYLDEFTALKEMGLALGQLAVAILCMLSFGILLG
jgi:hypothetical protein